MKSRKMKPHAKRINPARRSIQTKGKWKSIELDPSIFAEEGLEGLVCFEELTNYRLVDSEKVAARAAKELQKKEKKAQKRKAQKRKAIDVVETEGGEVSVEAKDAGESPKKKIKKKKAKLIKDESAEVAAETGQEEKLSEPVKDSTVGSQDDSEPKQAKKKKKKQKKSKKISLSELNTEKQKVQESISENKPVQANKDPKTKPAKAPKPRIKNWTSSALSGCEDTNSDMSAWKDLFVPVPVLRALSSLGFSSPTPIQALALPSAIRDRMDILGAAETGSGKTLAFAIPMIHSILEWRENHDNPDPKVDNPKPNTVKSLYLPDEPENAAPEAEEEKDLEEGDLEEGDLEEGDLEEGDLEEGDLEEGDLEEGDLEEGDLEEGDLEEGDLKECVDPGDSDVGEDMNDGTNGSDEDGANDIKLGCVQVGEKTPFDPTPQEETVNNEGQNRPLLGLVLTPTRELAVQVKHHIDAVAKFTNITSAIVVGGMSQHKQRRLLKRRPEIVVGTPGRLWDLIKERDPHLQNLRQLRCLVIDEADRMVERGHFAELESLLEMLHTTHFNPKRQAFVFSATLTLSYALPTRILQKKKRVDKRSKLEILMDKVGIKTKPKVIDLSRKEATVETLTETQIQCQKEDKDYYLYYFLLQHPGRTMVFANSIDCIKRLKSILTILDCTSFSLHANMQQKHRLKNLEKFADRESCVLLTTDVAARGLDIPDVQHVIHYQVPRTSETYVHRSGRTARAAKQGLCLLLTGPDDMLNFKKIFKTLGKDEELPLFPIETQCMQAIKERVDLAIKIESIEYHNCKEKKHDSWFRQAAEALEVDLDEDLLMGKSNDEQADIQQQKMVKEMKKHLKQLISQPVFKNVMKTKYPTQMGKLALEKISLAGTQSALTRVLIQKSKQKVKNQQKVKKGRSQRRNQKKEQQK